MDDFGGMQLAGPATFARSLRDEGGIGLADYLTSRLYSAYDSTFLGAATNRGLMDMGRTIGDIPDMDDYVADEVKDSRKLSGEDLNAMKKAGEINAGLSHHEGMTLGEARARTEAMNDRQWAEYAVDTSQFGLRSFVGLGAEVLAMPLADPIGTAVLGSGIGATAGRRVLGRLMQDMGVVLPSVVGEIALQDGYVVANHLLEGETRKYEMTEAERASRGIGEMVMLSSVLGIFGGYAHGSAARRALTGMVEDIGMAEARAMRAVPQEQAAAAALSERILFLMGVGDSPVIGDLKRFPGMAEALELANTERAAIRAERGQYAALDDAALSSRLAALEGGEGAFGAESRMLRYELDHRAERAAFFERRTAGKEYTSDDYEYLSRALRDDLWLEDKVWSMERQDVPQAAADPMRVVEGEHVASSPVPEVRPVETKPQGTPAIDIAQREADLQRGLWDIEGEIEVRKLQNEDATPFIEQRDALMSQLRALEKERTALRETNIAESAALDYASDARAADVLAELHAGRVC